MGHYAKLKRKTSSGQTRTDHKAFFMVGSNPLLALIRQVSAQRWEVSVSYGRRAVDLGQFRRLYKAKRAVKGLCGVLEAVQ